MRIIPLPRSPRQIRHLSWLLAFFAMGILGIFMYYIAAAEPFFGSASTPDVTINQKNVQADATGATPVIYTVVFSQPISVPSFTAADVQLNGTAGSKSVSGLQEVAPNDGTTFEVSVTATSSGSIVATIPAGGVQNLTAENNSQSTSTDNYVLFVAPPTVTAQAASNVTVSSANLAGTVTGGNNTVRQQGFEYGTDTSYGQTTTPDDYQLQAYDGHFGSLGFGNGQFNGVGHVAFDASGNIYVADTASNRIQKFNSSGVYQSQFGTAGTSDGEFASPRCMAFDTSGNMFVADTGNNRIQKFNSSGVYQSQFGTTGSGDGQFSGPRCVALAPDGSIYVTDTGNNRIQKFNSSGVYQSQFGASGSGNGQFAFAQGIAVDSLGNVYVADGDNNRIQKFNSSGTFVTTWGAEGVDTDNTSRGRGRLFAPRSISIDSQDVIYVANTSSKRSVQKFTSSGAFIAEWPAGDGMTAVHTWSVAVSSTGKVAVTDNNNPYVHIHTQTVPNASFSASVTNLSCGTTYHYRAYAANVPDSGYSKGYSSDATFTTTACPNYPDPVQATVTTLPASSVTQTTAVMNATINDSSETLLQRRFNSNYKVPGGASILILEGQQYTETLTPGVAYAGKWGSSGASNGQFSGPKSVERDSDGNIYVADTGNNRIQKFNSSGVYQSQFGASGSGNGQFSGPTDLAVDTSGNIYVADTGNNRIQKFNSSGVYQSKFGTNGSSDGQFDQPTSVAIGRLGDIYVADSGNHRIQTFDSNGTFVAAIGSLGSQQGEFNGTIKLAIYHSPSNDEVFAVDSINNRVQEVYGSGSASLFGSLGTGNGQFNTISDIAADSNGYLYITDGGNNRIQKFDLEGTFLYKFGSSGTGNGQFSQPSGLAVDEQSNVYIADTGNNRIQKLDSIINSGAFSHELSGLVCGTPYIYTASALNGASPNRAYGGDVSFTTAACPPGVPTVLTGPSLDLTKTAGTLTAEVTTDLHLLTERGFRYGPTTSYGRVVSEYFEDTSYTGRFGTAGTGDGQFTGGVGIARSSDGSIYVVDGQNNRIQKFDANGTFITKWGTAGTGNGQFDTPVAVAVDQSGNVYVADHDNNRIQKFDANGTFITKWGTAGTGNGQFTDILAMTIDSANMVYVTNAGNGTFDADIQKFDSSGTFVAKWTNSTVNDIDNIPADNFAIPFGIATDSDRNVYVVSTFLGKVVKFDSNGNYLTSIGSAGSGEGQFFTPWGIAIDQQNNVLVTDTALNRIQKFDSSGTFITKWSATPATNSQDQPGSLVGIVMDGNNNAMVLDIFGVQKFKVAPLRAAAFNLGLLSMTCGTTYHYQAFARTADLTSYGADQVFTTAACDPQPPTTSPPTTKPTTVDNTPPPSIPSSNNLAQRQFVARGTTIETAKRSWLDILFKHKIFKAISYLIIYLILLMAVLYARQAIKEYLLRQRIIRTARRYQATVQAANDYLAITTHYLNTPVSIMSGAVELVASLNLLPAQVTSGLQTKVAAFSAAVQGILVQNQTSAAQSSGDQEQAVRPYTANPLKQRAVIVPAVIALGCLIIANILFVHVGVLTSSVVRIAIELGLLLLAVLLLAISWHYREVAEKLRALAEAHLKDQAHLFDQRRAFMDSAYSTLTQYVEDLELAGSRLQGVEQGKLYFNGLAMLKSLTLGLAAVHQTTDMRAQAPLFAVTAYLQKLAKDFEPQAAPRDIDLQTRIDEGIAVHIQPDEFKMLMSSVVDNALKFSNQGGLVRISAKKRFSKVTIEVVDNGVGISKEKLGELFQPFSRATDWLKFDYQGSGLSLYIDKVILARLGGDIKISSEKAKGTVVTITLPTANQKDVLVAPEVISPNAAGAVITPQAS